MVVRLCNDYDKADFEVGDVLPRSFVICSADLTWENKSVNRYIIKTFDAEHNKAWNLFDLYYISEKQVTFIQDAKFCITAISDLGVEVKQINIKKI